VRTSSVVTDVYAKLDSSKWDHASVVVGI